MFKKLLVSLCVLYSTSVLAQLPQRLPGIPLLGVALMERPNDIPGVMVVQVGEGTPAAASGLAPGDFVVRMGERSITTVGDVLAALEELSPGASIEIVVRRADEEQPLRVTPGPAL